SKRWTEANAGTNAAGGGWWFIENMRHSNSGNYWGRQIAWGWEGGNANRTLTRNVSAGTWGAWQEFVMNNGGTWGINITGGAGNANTLAGMGVAPDAGANAGNQILRNSGDGHWRHPNYYIFCSYINT